MLGTLFLPMVAFLQPSHPTGRGSLAEAMVARSSCHLSPTCQKRDRKEKYGDCYFVLKTSVVAPVHLSHSLNTEPEICLLLREIRKVNRVPLAKYREKKITATSGSHAKLSVLNGTANICCVFGEVGHTAFLLQLPPAARARDHRLGLPVWL